LVVCGLLACRFAGGDAPEAGVPQVSIGIPSYVISACDHAIWTVDYAPEAGEVMNFWEAHPDVPPPERFTYSASDGHELLDYCTHPGHPITFMMERGQVVEAAPEDEVLTIEITRGAAQGVLLTVRRIDLDTDPRRQGVQGLAVGETVSRGDVIAHTNATGRAPGSGPSTAVGILSEEGYDPRQEMMLIGPDGEPNILFVD
jgi:hypothetical protein